MRVANGVILAKTRLFMNLYIDPRRNNLRGEFSELREPGSLSTPLPRMLESSQCALCKISALRYPLDAKDESQIRAHGDSWAASGCFEFHSEIWRGRLIETEILRCVGVSRAT